MIINFNQELSEEFGNEIVGQLLDVYAKNEAILDANSRLRYREDWLPLYCDEMTFMINSPGGSLYSFIQIWDIIDKLKSQGVKIKAEVQSHAMSAGFFLFMLADERRMNKLGTLLYHEMLIGNSMKLSDWNLETHRMDKIQKALDKLVTDNTNITQDMLDKYKGKDWYIDYDEALELGIIEPELTEEEQLAKALEDMDKEEMTQSEFDAFVEEMKELINIVPDKPTEKEIQDKIKEIEGDTEPDMTLGEAVKEVLGEDFRCNGETKCDEFEDRCCYMCENFDKCDKLCKYAEKADICEHMENKLDELDSECEDCTCKENKQEDIKECEEPTECGLHRGTNTCCYFCPDFNECTDFNKCVYSNESFDCEYLKEPSND
jgi:ATP-dependent protease ClpP protease subunit